MSNQLPHKEMIDAYLTGSLSPEDSERFLQSMEQDPALKEEFQLQQDLVHSLQNFRKQQLKARLDTIDVSSGYSFTATAGIKVMVGGALIAILGVGTYFAFTQLNQPGEPEIQPIELSIEDRLILEKGTLPQRPLAKNEEASELLTPDQGADAAALSGKATSISGNPIRKSAKAELGKASDSRTAKDRAAIADVKETSPSAASPQVVKPDVLSQFEEKDALGNSPKAEAPEDKMADIRSFDTKNIEVSTKTDKRYPFHYSFFENQLHIYGDFSQVPYEVLEVNTGLSTNYYLYHDSSYYQLNPKQQKVTRLKKLTNQKIINELEITRAEKLNH